MVVFSLCFLLVAGVWGGIMLGGYLTQRHEEKRERINTMVAVVNQDLGVTLEDRAVTSMRCCKCGLPVWKRVRWFSTGSNIYLSLVQCPRHGLIKGKLRMKKAPDGGVFAVKTIKVADEESIQMIREKKESVKTKRKERRKRRKGLPR